MKRALALSFLMTLAGCGGGGGGSTPNNSKIIENYETSFAPKRGEISLKSEAGNMAEIDITDGRLILRNGGLMKEGKEIIVKVEGDKIYKYVEEKNFDNNEVTRTVELEKNNIKDQMLKFLNEGKAVIGNDTFFLTVTGSSDDDDMGLRYRSNYKFDVEVSMLRPFCQTKSTSVSSIIVNYNGQEERLDNVKQTSTANCGERLTSAQLKALDLSSIEFCDGTIENEYNCTSNENMEFLTDDL